MRILSIFSVLIIITCLAFSSCGPRAISQLQYRELRNFRIMSLSLEPEVGMDLQFYNPNAIGVVIKKADLAVFINDKHIGNTVLTRSFAVPPTDTFLMPVKLRANLTGVFANAYSLLSNKEVTIRVQGTVKAGKGVYVNVPVDFSRKQKLNVIGF